jgi:VanZ family protein
MYALNRMIAPLIRHHRAFAILLACYWGLLFLGTHIPLPRLGELPKHSDKGMHLIAYAGLSFLLLLWISTVRKLEFRHFVMVFAITVLYAAADELLQIPVNRTCDIYDALADCLGSVIGLLSAVIIRRVLLRFWEPAEFAS